MKGINVEVRDAVLENENVIYVAKPHENQIPDDNTYALIHEEVFHNGIIDVDVRSRLLPTADEMNRGFIGIVFRAKEDASEFESFYIRPTNRNTDDPVRKQHGCQYFSYPGYTFAYFRKHGIEGYEAPIEGYLDKWFHLRAVIHEDKAKFYVDDMETPVLCIEHLKHGKDAKGYVGLYVDNGTEGYFKNLVIENV